LESDDCIKLSAAGITITSISGVGTGIGLLFNGFLNSLSINFELEEKLSTFFYYVSYRLSYMILLPNVLQITE